MTETETLAKLHDIVLPRPIGLWPLAIGWDLLLLGFFLGLGLALFLFYKKHRDNQAKREALGCLKAFETRYLEDNNDVAAAAAISGLLKRVALAYFPIETVAHLEGEAWLLFLNQEVKGFSLDPAALTYLIDRPYRKENQGLGKQNNITPLFKFAAQWIKQRGKPCLN